MDTPGSTFSTSASTCPQGSNCLGEAAATWPAIKEVSEKDMAQVRTAEQLAALVVAIVLAQAILHTMWRFSRS